MSFILNPHRFGEVGWRPTDLGANLIAWWDANNAGSITKDGSDYVSQWNDLSTNGYNLTQGTGTNQPQWQTGILNGKPGLSFSTNDYMINASIATVQPICVVFVIKNPATSIGSNEYVYDSVGGTNRVALIKESTSGADDYTLYAGTVRDTGYGYLTTGELCKACYNQPSSSSFSYNASSSSFGAAGTQRFDGITVGSRYNNIDFLNAHLCEMFIVDKILNATEISEYESYLKPKYGFTY